MELFRAARGPERLNLQRQFKIASLSGPLSDLRNERNRYGWGEGLRGSAVRQWDVPGRTCVGVQGRSLSGTAEGFVSGGHRPPGLSSVGGAHPWLETKRKREFQGKTPLRSTCPAGARHVGFGQQWRADIGLITPWSRRSARCERGASRGRTTRTPGPRASRCPTRRRCRYRLP